MFPSSNAEEEKGHKIRVQAFERDGYKCHSCQTQLTRFTATLDYVTPIEEGGDDSQHERLASEGQARCFPRRPKQITGHS